MPITDTSKSPRLALWVAGALALVLSLAAATGIDTSQTLTAAPSAVNLSSVSAAEGSSNAHARADHTHSLSGTLPEARGGTGAGALTCNAAQATTSDGTAYSCLPSLGIAYGGTNSSATPTSGGIAYGTGAAYAFTSNPADGTQFLSGTNPPTWATVTTARRTSGAAAYFSWPLTETAKPFANEGTAGSGGNFDTDGTKAMTFGRAGLFNNSLEIPDASGGNYGIVASGSTNLETPTSVTGVTAILWVRSIQDSFFSGFGKLYRPVASGLSSPYFAYDLRVEGSTGNITFYVTVSGTLKSCQTPSTGSALELITPGVWNLIYGSYDGANMQVGINGVIVKTCAQTGTIDYGTHGEVFLGMAPGEGGLGPNTSLYFSDPRIYASVVSASTYLSMYRTGVNLN